MDSDALQGKIANNPQFNEPKSIKLAGIDIGTNTILMVIGEKKQNGELSFICNEHSIARLGESVDKTRIIKTEAIERAKKILIKYKNICDENNVSKISAAGTSALRDAINRNSVIEELSSVINTEINVITGEEEARLSFLGTIENDNPSIVVDIGGGSTEFILGEKKNVKIRHSLSIGAVRLTERFFKIQPTSIDCITQAENLIQENLQIVDRKIFKGELIGVAGTPTTLAAVAQELTKFEKDKVHNYVLNIEKVNNIFNNLKAKSIEQIKQITGIHPDRADIITAGTLILLSIMKYLEINECKVSSRGLRYGIIIDLANKF
ncbi:MAG: Ppx/GppA family phosphatase [Ignavibacteriae bacterium]|nr:Ppx/GppA family phosphatase [Ignavibacteriota bacterium]